MGIKFMQNKVACIYLYHSASTTVRAGEHNTCLITVCLAYLHNREHGHYDKLISIPTKPRTKITKTILHTNTNTNTISPITINFVEQCKS